MAAPNSSVDLCNLAFDLLRHKDAVTNIDSQSASLSDSEALAARWYDATRRSVLRGFPWNFARKRAVLSRNAVAPAFGYADAYNLPNDYVAPVFIGNNYIDDYIDKFSVEGGQILLDNNAATSLNFCYIWDITTVVKFDPIFIDLLVAELALRFGNSLTGLNKSMKEINARVEKLELKARAMNGRENPPRMRSYSPLLNRRLRLTGGSQYDGVHLF